MEWVLGAAPILGRVLRQRKGLRHVTVGVPTSCTSINHSVKYGNQVYILDVDDENIIINKNIFLQQSGEIRHTNASLPDKDVLVTFTIKVHLSSF